MKPKNHQSSESVAREINRKTRRKFSGEESIATICRREGIAPTVYYKWSKSFLKAGKRRFVSK